MIGEMEKGEGSLEDVGGAETQQGATAADVVEVVVCVGHSQSTNILVTIAVRVSDQGALRL